MKSKWLERLGLALLVNGILAGGTIAQSYPSKPVRLIASAAPGGSVDFIGRLMSERMSPVFGQALIVDHRVGAAGNIAAEFTARAPADGYTLLICTTSHAANISLYSKLTYDPVKDFAPITHLVSNTFAVAVLPSTPANTLGEFVALARSKGGRTSYGSAGIGQGNHLGMELLKNLANFDAIHVPYGGVGPAITALLGGTVDVSIPTLTAALPLVQAGKLRALATTGAKRSPLLPNVPTVSESGYPGYELISWLGLLAPAGTARDIIERWHRETARALRQPDVASRLTALDFEAVVSPPDEFASFLKSEIIKWGRMVKDSGAKVD